MNTSVNGLSANCLSVSDLLPQVAYNPYTGSFYRVRNDGSITTEVQLDEYGKLFIASSINQKKLIIKGIRAAWMIIHNKEIPEGMMVYAKNFDITDCKAFNIGMIPNSEYSLLKEAYNNINKYLKMKPHPTDKYSYIVYFREDGVTRKLVYADIVSAKRVHRKLLIKYTKVVGKYLSTE